MNTKYTYRWTNNYFEDANNNETDYIIEDDYYYILDGCNERTGEMYVVLNKEATDEDLVG